jgi:hypothetical protein
MTLLRGQNTKAAGRAIRQWIERPVSGHASFGPSACLNSLNLRLDGAFSKGRMISTGTVDYSHSQH